MSNSPSAAPVSGHKASSSFAQQMYEDRLQFLQEKLLFAQQQIAERDSQIEHYKQLVTTLQDLLVSRQQQRQCQSPPSSPQRKALSMSAPPSHELSPQHQRAPRAGSISYARFSRSAPLLPTYSPNNSSTPQLQSALKKSPPTNNKNNLQHSRSDPGPGRSAVFTGVRNTPAPHLDMGGVPVAAGNSRMSPPPMETGDIGVNYSSSESDEGEGEGKGGNNKPGKLKKNVSFHDEIEVRYLETLTHEGI